LTSDWSNKPTGFWLGLLFWLQTNSAPNTYRGSVRRTGIRT